jgi:hypothetical protein
MGAAEHDEEGSSSVSWRGAMRLVEGNTVGEFGLECWQEVCCLVGLRAGVRQNARCGDAATRIQTLGRRRGQTLGSDALSMIQTL